MYSGTDRFIEGSLATAPKKKKYRKCEIVDVSQQNCKTH